METHLTGWATYYDPANRRYFFVDISTGRSQWEDPRSNDFLPPYQVQPPVRLPGLPMQPPASLPISYTNTAPSHPPVQASSGTAVVDGGMAMAPLTVPETVVSEEVNGRYAKHGKKHGKSTKRRKDSWFDSDSDDDRKGGKDGKDGKDNKYAKDSKDGKVGKDDKKKKEEEEDLEFLEIVAEFL
ncbi:hypothetical protein BGZ81_010884 [Podila clonocystis]|nr:hypothetical protein BGZ81_010884 [Podila clonocystis]